MYCEIKFVLFEFELLKNLVFYSFLFKLLYRGYKQKYANKPIVIKFKLPH